MPEFSDRDWGRILSDIEYLKRDVEVVTTSLTKMQEDVNKISLVMSEARGHWRALLLFGTFCSVIGGLATKLLTYVKVW